MDEGPTMLYSDLKLNTKLHVFDHDRSDDMYKYGVCGNQLKWAHAKTCSALEATRECANRPPCPGCKRKQADVFTSFRLG